MTKLWGLEFLGFVGCQLKADPWVIPQQQWAACSHWTHLWEQDYDTPYPKFHNDKIGCVRVVYVGKSQDIQKERRGEDYQKGM